MNQTLRCERGSHRHALPDCRRPRGRPPEVLAADEKKYEQTGDEKYVKRARRRHKYGWTVGEET